MATGRYKRTPEMYASRRGQKRKPLSAEHRAKVGAALRGKAKSGAHRQALSTAHRGKTASQYSRVAGHTPRHRQAFKKMQMRARRLGLAVDFVWTPAGYASFVAHIGPVPEGMRKPTVGRYDHARGYVVGNFRWQEHAENVSESARRRHGKAKR